MGLRNGHVFLMTLEELGHVGDTGKTQQRNKGNVRIIGEYLMKNLGIKKVSGIVMKKQENTKALKEEAQTTSKKQKTHLNGSYEQVNHPEHYASSAIECIDAMEAMVDSQGRNYRIVLTGHMFYLWQVIFKYVWRWPFKEKPIEDLKKAEFYLKKLIKTLEKTNYVQK